MQELVDAIMAWPVIIQGALGSAVFWLILLIGQQIVSSAVSRYSTLSKKLRISWLTNERAKCMATMAESPESFSTYATILWYRASRHLIKAIMWLVMGLFSQTFVSVLGVIGFIGCLYYLFKAYEVVAPMHPESYNKKRLSEILEEEQQIIGVD